MAIKPSPLPDYGNHPIAANWVKCSPVRNKLGGGEFIGGSPCMTGGGISGSRRSGASKKKNEKENKTKNAKEIVRKNSAISRITTSVMGKNLA